MTKCIKCIRDLYLLGYCSLMPSCADFLERRKSSVLLSKLRTMLKISYARSRCLSQLILLLLKCVSQPEIDKKIHKNPYFSIQSYPRSLNSVAIESQCMTSY